MAPPKNATKVSQKCIMNVILVSFVLITLFLASIEVLGSQPTLIHSPTYSAPKLERQAISYPVTEDSPTICTYFEPFPSHRQDEFQAMVKIWNQSWTQQGWNTRVFTERDAAKYPGYRKLKNHLLNLPTVNDQRFEMTCYIRWVAMVASGCRWMSDIDMMNFGFPPQQPWHGPILFSYGGVMPALVTGSTEAFQAVINTLKQISLDPLNSTSVIRVNGKPHVSDMLVFANNPQLYLPLSYPLYASVPKSLALSPLMHFSFDDAVALRKSSKLELIYEARRIKSDPDPYHWPPTVCTYNPGPEVGPTAAAEWEEAYELWNRSWAGQGWGTRVLTVQDAAKHPRYGELRETLATLMAADTTDTPGGPAAVEARYLRWVAMLSSGCRWMCEPDVINFGFPPQPPWHGPVLYSFDGPEPTLVTGGLNAFQAALDAMEEAAVAARRDGAALPPAVTDDGRSVTADARVLGARPGLFLDIYFPLNISFPGPRAHSALLHLDAWDTAALGKTRATFVSDLRPLAQDPRPPRSVHSAVP